MAFLEVNELSRVYGAAEVQVKALDRVSFTVEKGQFVAVMGASGSGKSTLMHLLGGVDRPSAGSVMLDGISLYEQDDDALTIFRRRQIGLVYQFFNLVPLLTVEENLALPLLLDGRTPDAARVSDMLARLGLADKRKAFPAQLSGGQQQHVAIGRALLIRPALLLADEPTGNLDSASGKSVTDLLEYIHITTGQTVVMITHDESLALRAQRILHLQDGRIVKDEVIRP